MLSLCFKLFIKSNLVFILTYISETVNILIALYDKSYLLCIPLSEVSNVIWKNSEIVGDAVLVTEGNDDRQTDSWRWVPCTRGLRWRRPRHRRRQIHSLRHILRTLDIISHFNKTLKYFCTSYNYN